MATIVINGDLVLDQTASTQTPTDGNDKAINSQLLGLSTAFATALNTLDTNLAYAAFADLALDLTQRTYADTVDAAVSASNFVTVTDLGSSTLSGLRFSDANGDPLDGDQVFYPANTTTPLKTLDGSSIYLYNLTEDIVLATTGDTKGTGEIVAAFYLNQTGTTASVEQVTFMPIFHPDATSADDRVDWTDVLQVSADTSLAFSFDTLKSGKFLWVAVGDFERGTPPHGEGNQGQPADRRAAYREPGRRHGEHQSGRSGCHHRHRQPNDDSRRWRSSDAGHRL